MELDAITIRRVLNEEGEIQVEVEYGDTNFLNALSMLAYTQAVIALDYRIAADHYPED